MQDVSIRKLAFCFFLASLFVHFLFYIELEWGEDLVSAYLQSDAHFNFHKAWFATAVDDDGGAMGYVLPYSSYVSSLTLLFSLFGAKVSVAYALNSVITSFTAFMGVLLVNSLYGRAPAIVAGFLVAFCGVFVFFSSLTLKTSFVILELVIALYFSIQAIQKKSFLNMFLALLVIGVASYDRDNISILYPSLVAFFVFSFSEKLKRFQVFLYAIGVIFSISCLFSVFIPSGGIKNSIGVNLMYGNAPGAEGGYTPSPYYENNVIGARLGAYAHLVEEIGSKDATPYRFQMMHLEELIDYYQEYPFDFLVLKLKHLSNLLAGKSLGHPESFDTYKANFLTLTVCVIDWAVLLSLFLVFWSVRSISNVSRAEWFLLVSLLLYAGTVLIFLPLERYRLPLYLLILPFSSYALVRLIFEKNGRKIVFMVCSWIFLSFFIPVFPHSNVNDLSNAYREEVEKKEKNKEIYKLYSMAQPVESDGLDSIHLAYEIGKLGLEPDMLIICNKIYEYVSSIDFETKDSARSGKCSKQAKVLVEKSIWDSGVPGVYLNL